MLSFYVKVFYVMGKALSGGLSCPCDRSCLSPTFISVNSKRKEFARTWSKFFSFRVDSCQKGYILPREQTVSQESNCVPL